MWFIKFILCIAIIIALWSMLVLLEPKSEQAVEEKTKIEKEEKNRIITTPIGDFHLPI